MFFVGASAMPGTGVPVVCAGSSTVADLVDLFLSGQAKGSLKERENVQLHYFVRLVPLALLSVIFAALLAHLIG